MLTSMQELHPRTFILAVAILLAALAGVGSTQRVSEAGVEQERIHGDLDCSGALNSVDALIGIRYLAGLDTDVFEACPEMGGLVEHNLWGDVDCDRAISAVDFLRILRSVAALAVTQTPGCSVLGQVGAAPKVDWSELVVADADSGEVVAGYHSSAGFSSLMWSPNGDKIAFVGHSPDVFTEVIIADVTGNVTVVDPFLPGDERWFVRDLLWSPDGDQLAAVVMPQFVPDPKARILLIDAQDGTWDEVYSAVDDEPVQLELIHWLSGGSDIVAASGGDLVMIDLQTGERSVIFTGSRSFLGPSSVSPDESQVALVTGGQAEDCVLPNDALWIVDLDGGATSNLVCARDLTDVAWSPDGSEIAYAFQDLFGDSPDDRGAYTLDIESGESTRLTSPDTFDIAVEWLSDGSAIQVRRMSCYACDAFGAQWLLVPAQGGSEQLIVETGAFAGFGGFAPDSQRYLYSDDAVRIVNQAGGESVLTQPDPSTGYIKLSWSPSGTWVSYATTPTFTPVRHTVGVEEGSAVRQPLPDFLRRGGFELSPDGESVAFTRAVDPLAPPQFFVSSVDGTGERLLVDSDVGSFKWSADGKEIAYTTDDDPIMLRVVDVETVESRDIADLDGERRLVSWSPDGSLIAGMTPTRDLELVDVASGQITLVAVDLAFFEEPAWSPDGSQLAYGQNGSIVVYDLAIGVSNLLADGFSPSWSPDGQEIAFWRQLSDHPNPIRSLIARDVASGQERELARFADVSFAERSLVWSPSGDEIAVITGLHPASIYVASADGSDLTHVADLGGGLSYEDIRWSADGHEVSFTTVATGL